MDRIAATERQRRDPWSHSTYPALTVVIAYDEDTMQLVQITVELAASTATATYVLRGGYPWTANPPVYRRDGRPARPTHTETRVLSFDAQRHRIEALFADAAEQYPPWGELFETLRITPPRARRGRIKDIDSAQAEVMHAAGNTWAQVVAMLGVEEHSVKEDHRRQRRAGRL